MQDYVVNSAVARKAVNQKKGQWTKKRDSGFIVILTNTQRVVNSKALSEEKVNFDLWFCNLICILC